MIPDWPLLVRVFRRECLLGSLQISDWNLLISQARQSQLLGKLYYLAEEQRVLDSLPEAVFRHLYSARIHAEKQVRDFRWELVNLEEAFSNCGYPLIFLKGGSYVLAKLPPHQGRLFSDIDLLVPVDAIADAEKRLAIHGWLGDKQDSYDQQYYRRWMHEIPPLIHIRRGSVIDLHHNILPRTSTACPDSRLLVEAAIPAGSEANIEANIKVLSPLDRVIHSATHLFYDGELDHGMRDMVDLQQLVMDLETEAKLALVDRAQQLGLMSPLFYALHYLQIIFNVSDLDEALQKMANEGLSVRRAGVMDALFIRALLPDHVSCSDHWTPFARWLLYVRAHWLRMPWYLLLPHLARKAWLRRTGSKH